MQAACVSIKTPALASMVFNIAFRKRPQKTLTKIGVQINKIYLLVLYLPSRRFPWGLVVLYVY